MCMIADGTSLTSQLWRRGTHQRHEACRIDDAPARAQSLGLVRRIVAHREDSVLAAPPHALEIDLHRQIPDLLLRVQRVVVRRVHDTYKPDSIHSLLIGGSRETHQHY